MKIDYPKRHKLANLPTAIIPLNTLSKQFDKTNIWLKRDDLTGIELSGNKIRKLEYLLYEATNHGAERILTCGGLQSNHCRTAAYASLKLGLKVTLFLRGNDESPGIANHLLNKLTGADIVYLTKEEYNDVDAYMAEAASSYNDVCYVIPEGGSNETGAWGYIRCYHEILKQQEELNITFDAIIVATGSGGTHAGLLLGNKIYSGPEVFSVIVCDDKNYFITKIGKICDSFVKKYAFIDICRFASVI